MKNPIILSFIVAAKTFAQHHASTGQKILINDAGLASLLIY